MNNILGTLDLYRLAIYCVLACSKTAWAYRAHSAAGRWFMGSGAGYFAGLALATIARRYGHDTMPYLNALCIPLTGMLLSSIWAIWGENVQRWWALWRHQ